MITDVQPPAQVLYEHVIAQLTVLALLEPTRPLRCIALHPEARAHAAWAFAVSEAHVEHWA